MRPLREDEYWDRTRRQMIAETQAWLERALREPYRAPVIPSFPVGHGRFSPMVVAAFWRRILFGDDE